MSPVPLKKHIEVQCARCRKAYPQGILPFIHLGDCQSFVRRRNSLSGVCLLSPKNSDLPSSMIHIHDTQSRPAYRHAAYQLQKSTGARE